MTKEDLQQFREMMSEIIDEKLQPINNRLVNIEEQMTDMKEQIADMKTDIEEIKEDGKITRVATNEVVKWIEMHSDNDDPFPVKQQAI